MHFVAAAQQGGPIYHLTIFCIIFKSPNDIQEVIIIKLTGKEIYIIIYSVLKTINIYISFLLPSTEAGIILKY